MSDIWSINAYSWKRKLLHYLHNRHLKLVDVTFEDNVFFRALSVMRMTSEGGHMLVCNHCISKWIRKLGSCYFMIDSHRCVAPWLQYPNNWWLRCCQRKHGLHWWVGALYATYGTSSKPKPYLAPKDGPVGLFPWQVLILLVLSMMAIISSRQYLSYWWAPGKVKTCFN